MSEPTTRRAAIGALASLPALAILPAVAITATPVDPVFAAIERHKTAPKAFVVASNATDTVLAKQQTREITQADEDAFSAASDVERGVLDELYATPPETFAGMRAVLLHFYATDEQGDIAEFLLRSPLFATI
jgi:hypothetical protein